MTRELLSMPKEEAYAKGEALIQKKKYEVGRQYLRFVAENYANDAIGKQAALRLADSYYDEKTPLGYLEAGVRYKDFRNRYPSHPRSDYALFRLAQCSDKQAEGPDREQTNTRQAATSYRELIINYPDSPYATEARARLGVMRNLLAEHEYLVGHFYLKRKAWRAARGRMEFILAAYPEYAGLDKVLYEAGLLEGKMGNRDEEKSLWQRLRKDYPASPVVKKLPPAPASPPVPDRAAGG
jgi:outer membrane protein assembly factor BamD